MALPSAPTSAMCPKVLGNACRFISCSKAPPQTFCNYILAGATRGVAAVLPAVATPAIAVAAAANTPVVKISAIVPAHW